jgi:hypothetical protein
VSAAGYGAGDSVPTATGSIYVVPLDPMESLMCDSCQ